MLEVTRPTTTQGHEELNPATTGSTLDFIDRSPTPLLCRRSLKGCCGKLCKSSSRPTQGEDEEYFRPPPPPAGFLDEDTNLVLGTQEEYIAQAIRWYFEPEDSQPLADVIVELSTIRKSLTNQLGGYQEAIHDYLRQDKLPNVLNRLRDSLYGTIEILEQTADKKRKNEGIEILNNFFERELKDPEMKDQLSAQKARFDRLRKTDPSTSTPSEEASTSATAVVTRPLSETPGTSHGEIPLLDKANIWKWSNQHSLAELECWNRLKEADHRLLGTTITSLYKDIVSFLESTGTSGWREPASLTVENYKSLEGIESQRKDVIREIKMRLRSSTDNISEQDKKKWTRLKTVALQILVIESISGPHSKEALGVLQFLHENENTKLTNEALETAQQLQEKKVKEAPTENMEDIFSLVDPIEEESNSE